MANLLYVDVPRFFVPEGIGLIIGCLLKLSTTLASVDLSKLRGELLEWERTYNTIRLH